MLDVKLLRTNSNDLERALKRRSDQYELKPLVLLDQQRRQALQQEEALRAEQNMATERIKKASAEERATLIAQAKTLSEQLKSIEQTRIEAEAQLDAQWMALPNLPNAEVPDGQDESQNVVLYEWGNEFKARTRPNPLDHWDIGLNHDVIDIERGVKLAQSRFSVIKGTGARLVRALIGLMLDTHIGQHGYQEIMPPLLVNHQAMTGTGQLPKFEADLFACRDDALFLIPTAEVPVTNLYANEPFEDPSVFPLNMVAYTPCFRREAGSAGKDTRGLIRQHQFDKIELVKLTLPEQSAEEHLKLRAHAERILQLLELPYRVVELCAGDLGFSAARCYDLEVWMPAQGVYREISSCSNFADFQARRIGLKYRHPDTQKLTFLHTLNGSGLAVGRTLAAILENYQWADLNQSEVALPQALAPYFQVGLGHVPERLL